MIRELARNPGPYLEERIKYPQLRTQFVIVLLAGLATSIWNLALFDILGASAAYVEDVLMILTFMGMIEYLLWWLILTGVMKFAASLLGGQTSYVQLLRVSGYGFLPLIVAGGIWSAGRYVGLGATTTPEPPYTTSFPARLESYNKYMEAYSGEPAILVGLVLGTVFVIAAGVIWARGIEVATDLDFGRAGVAAGTAVTILIFRVFYPII